MEQPLAPWKKPESGKREPWKKETIIGGYSGGYVDDDSDDDEVYPDDPIKSRQAEISESHRDILRLFAKRPHNSASGSKSKPPDLKQEAEVEEFKRRYGDILVEAGEGEKTILHRIVESPTDARPLLRWLLTTYEKLILQRDSKGNTALYSALVVDRSRFVSTVLKCSKNSAEALQIPGDDGTCLHIALKLQHSLPDSVPTQDRRSADGPHGQQTMKRQHVDVDRMIAELQGSPSVQKEGEPATGTALRDILKRLDKRGNNLLHVAWSAIAEHIEKHAIHCNNDSTDPPTLTPSVSVLEHMVQVGTKLMEEYPEAIYQENHNGQLPYTCLGSAKLLKSCTSMVEEIKLAYMRKLAHEEVNELLYPNGTNGQSTLI